jgi:hypothetical protein
LILFAYIFLRPSKIPSKECPQFWPYCFFFHKYLCFSSKAYFSKKDIAFLSIVIIAANYLVNFLTLKHFSKTEDIESVNCHSYFLFLSCLLDYFLIVFYLLSSDIVFLVLFDFQNFPDLIKYIVFHICF